MLIDRHDKMCSELKKFETAKSNEFINSVRSFFIDLNLSLRNFQEVIEEYYKTRNWTSCDNFIEFAEEKLNPNGKEIL